jgi:hypothetical protein
MRVGGKKVLARKIEKSTKTKRSYKEKPKEREEKMAKGLQKELDTLVPPISVRKESDLNERVEERAGEGAEKTISEVPLEKKLPALEKPIKKERAKPAKRKVNPWGIVIGETD